MANVEEQQLLEAPVEAEEGKQSHAGLAEEDSMYSSN